MTAADNAHLAEVAGLVSKRAGAEFNMLFRRSADFRQASSVGSEIRGTTVSDPTASSAITSLSGRVDPMTTLHGDLVKARQQCIWWLNKMLSLADMAVAVDTAERVHAGGDGKTVDEMNLRSGWCQACGSKYAHGDRNDRLRLLHGTLLVCDACRKSWERSDDKSDGNWQDWLADRKRRGLAARGDVDAVDVA